MSYPQPQRRGFNPTAFVLVLVLAAVGFGVYWALDHALNGFVPPLTSNAARPSPSATGADGQPAAATVRPVIESGIALDPEGAADGDKKGEHPEAAPLAYDGAPETVWYTRYYNTPDYSGIKSGVGYAITLKEEATVNTIALLTNCTGGKIEVRATTADKPTEGEVLASGEFSAETNLQLKPTKSKTFVLWFPELPQNAKEQNKIEIKEILVS